MHRPWSLLMFTVGLESWREISMSEWEAEEAYFSCIRAYGAEQGSVWRKIAYISDFLEEWVSHQWGISRAPWNAQITWDIILAAPLEAHDVNLRKVEISIWDRKWSPPRASQQSPAQQNRAQKSRSCLNAVTLLLISLGLPDDDISLLSFKSISNISVPFYGAHLFFWDASLKWRL